MVAETLRAAEIFLLAGAVGSPRAAFALLAAALFVLPAACGFQETSAPVVAWD